MRLGKYEASEGSGVSTAITFLLIGLGAGALTALLLAPKGGKQMRRDLRRNTKARAKPSTIGPRMPRIRRKTVYERGSEIADDLRERVSPIAKAMRRMLISQGGNRGTVSPGRRASVTAKMPGRKSVQPEAYFNIDLRGDRLSVFPAGSKRHVFTFPGSLVQSQAHGAHDANVFRETVLAHNHPQKH